MASKKKNKEDPHIFAVIRDSDDGDPVLLGYFGRIEDVERFFERENIESARILTVTRVEDAEYPPEPMLEFEERKLSDVVSGDV